MENVRLVLSATLIASALAGSLIVISDQYLWYAAPSHAYGLIAFVAMDIGVAALIWRKPWLAALLSTGLATVQVIAMIGDVLTYSSPYVTQETFRSYLLNNREFVALLLIQPIILALSLSISNLRIEYLIVRQWFRTRLPH